MDRSKSRWRGCEDSSTHQLVYQKIVRDNYRERSGLLILLCSSALCYVPPYEHSYYKHMAQPMHGEVTMAIRIHRKAVLVVEDDEGIRETLKMLFSLNGYQSYVACNGEEGLKLLKEIPQPCLILLDLMMPVMDGAQFAHILREQEQFKRIPIFAVTAFGDRASKLPVDGVIKKPFELDRIIEVIKQYCG